MVLYILKRGRETNDSVFLILVLIGYIVDQKRKLKKVKEQGVANSEVNINTPVQEEVQNVNVVPAPVAAEPVVEQPVSNVTNTIETPTFEPVAPITETPIVETPMTEVVTPVVEQPVNDLQSEPIFEEAPQTILDIPDNVADIQVPVQENAEPVEIQTPVIEDAEIIEEPEVIGEPANTQSVVNSWEPEVIQQTNDIINENENKDSI